MAGVILGLAYIWAGMMLLERREDLARLTRDHGRDKISLSAGGVAAGGTVGILMGVLLIFLGIG